MPIVRLFVTNLSYDVEEQDLREVFAKAGKPTIINIMKDRDSGKPRGFGFVTLDTLNKDIDCWREMLQGYILNGRAIHVDFAIPKDKKSLINE